MFEDHAAPGDPNTAQDPAWSWAVEPTLDPLSAPRPCSENGGRDPRPTERRRAEALIEICRRATAAGGDAPATSKAQVVVLIDHDMDRRRTHRTHQPRTFMCRPPHLVHQHDLTATDVTWHT